MDRKEFLKNSLLATGAILTPNAIWAFDKNLTVEKKSLYNFVSKPNLKRFKISVNGTKYFETELKILTPKVNFNLHRKFFISKSINGICTPALLETNNKESLVFIPELYKGKKHNGFIVKICENGLCEEIKVFTHENQGYYAFWGKEYLGNPTLYHYNVETFHIMRIHQENGNWINKRVMPINPNEMIALYKQQLQQIKQGQLTQQFGHDFDIHKDRFYNFLSLKHSWEQDIIIKEKEQYEKENPAKIYAENTFAGTKEKNFDGYTNPFVPIWCEGDDTSYAVEKPTVFYKEIADTKIEIPNMPAYKTQDDLGDCKAFSLAAILQQYVNTKWKSDIPDPKNPPADSAISHFGLMAYTNQTKELDKTLQFLQTNGKGVDEVIDTLSKNGNQLILENCKPFENLTHEFSINGLSGLNKRDEFFNYLQNIFLTLKNTNEAEIKDCSQEIIKLNKFVNLNFNQVNLKKALIKDNFDQFLYTLLFNECKFENFPSGFRAAKFPLDSMDVTPEEIKQQIIIGLNKNKPVMLALCVSQDKSNTCTGEHLLVISGYKKVESNISKKEAFKLHNSWGIEWQKINNDGWVDADELCKNTARVNSDKGLRIGSASVVWLDT